ncbi:MAG: PfkB family carbohydrate kinase [Spirochaetota bacterium]|jgi:sugar/nucleoside kinase (ribokinase family)|nr:PfkB family carbohydrate kinase [Spirochaetota bacterium]
MAITVVGSVALDSIASAEGSVEKEIGGSAIHFSNAASLCTKVYVIGVVGEDYPFERIEFLKRRGVDFSGLEIVPGGKTFFWKGRYEGNMGTAISEATELNVFQNFAPKLSGLARESGFLFLANIHPSLQLHIRRDIGSSAFAVLDSMNYWIDTIPEELYQVIACVNAVILNSDEILSLTGKKSLLSAARYLLTRGPDYVIIKKGEHGVLAVARDWVAALPAFALDRIVDPTGAGDSFAGALVSYLDRASSFAPEAWKKALAYATCVASFNVQGFSVSGIASIGVRDVLKRFQEYCNMFEIQGGLDALSDAAG